jgi:hypothetical protein
MPATWNRNRLPEKLGIDYLLIQGPLGGLSSQRLTAAVSNFGGLGSFGAHGLAPEAIQDIITQIRSLTSKPFAMNLWVSMEDKGAQTSDESAFNRSLAPLTVHLAALGAPVRHTNHIYRPDSKIRLAYWWTQTYRHSASSTVFRRRRFSTSAGRKASSRSARRQHPTRPRYFRMPAWILLSPRALRPVAIAVHSFRPRKIH